MIDYFNKHSKEWDKKQYRMERAMVVAKEIKSTIPLTKRSKVLDFGCGTGVLGLELADSVGEIWLGDNSEGMLAEVRRKIQKIENAIAINLDNEERMPQFDAIVSLLVLHHIDEVGEQIKKLASWILNDGYICLCDLDKEDGSYHQEEIVPHNGFDRGFIEEKLKENQVEILSETTVYKNRKMVDGLEKEYPIFMIVGKKTASI